MTPVVVYGAGGMGREVAETVLACTEAGGSLSLVGYIDDRPGAVGTQISGIPVVGDGTWIADNMGVAAVLGIGHPRIRYEVVQKVLETGGRWETLIHPTVVLSRSATVGEGAVIFAGCVVSSDAKIGAYSYMNYNAVVSHDVAVSDFACIMAQVALSGNVEVGEGAFVGVGASTRQQVKIGQWSIIGAGACVVRDIPPYCIATGVPAVPTRHYANRDQMPAF